MLTLEQIRQYFPEEIAKRNPRGLLIEYLQYELLALEGSIGSSAAYHYSFMGAADPAAMEPAARNLAALLKGDRVDAVLLVPV